MIFYLKNKGSYDSNDLPRIYHAFHVFAMLYCYSHANGKAHCYCSVISLLINNILSN